MNANFVSFTIRKNHLITIMEVEEGVKWEIVAAVNYKEILKFAKAILAPSILWYLLSGWARQKDTEPLNPQNDQFSIKKIG